MVGQIAAGGVEPIALVLVALIGAVPPTLVAWGGLRHSREAKNQATAANEAVNCRPEGAPSISQQVDRIASTTQRLDDRVTDVSDELRHQRRELAHIAVEVGRHGRILDEHLGES